MKIAILTDGIYPFVIGGMQKHSYYLIKYLAQQKIFLRVYHCIPENNNDLSKIKNVFTDDELKYIEFIEIPFDFRSHFPGYYLLESYFYSKRIYKHLIRDILNFDFIYCKGFTGWYLLKHKKNNFPKIAVKLHGYEMYQYAPNIKTKLQHYWLRIPARFVTHKADIIFSYGSKITEILTRVLKLQQNKIIELPTGIDKNLIFQNETPYHQPISFIFIGRYEKRKGIENIILVLKALMAAQKKFVFHFVGDIPSHLIVQDKNIIYHGKINDYNKISDILRACDVLVCPSYSEGMPNVIIEAMANGLTVVATNVGAVSVLVNEHTGYLLSDNTFEELLHIFEHIISEKKEVLQSKKKAALEHSKNFIWEKISLQFIDQIKKFLPPR